MVEFKDLGKSISDVFGEGWSTNTKLQDKSGNFVTTWENGLGTKLTKKHVYAGVNLEHVVDASQKKGLLQSHTGKWGNLSAVLKVEADQEKNVEVTVKETLLDGLKLEASAKVLWKKELTHASNVTATWVRSCNQIGDFGAQFKFTTSSEKQWALAPVLSLVTSPTAFPVSAFAKYDGAKNCLITHFQTRDFDFFGAKSSVAALVDASIAKKEVTNVAVAAVTGCCKGYSIKTKLDGLNKKVMEPQVSITKKEKYENDTITLTGAWKFTCEGVKFGLSFTKA